MLVAALAVMSTGMVPGYSEIYRYQDDRGHWVFTDRPPSSSMLTAPDAGPRLSSEPRPQPAGSAAAPGAGLGLEPPDVGDAPPAPTRSPAPRLGAPPAEAQQPPTVASVSPHAPSPDPRPDLAQWLMRLFKPVTAVETSSLAVVTVKSELDAGSGFFVSDDGWLLTNRHLVRPPADWAAEDMAALAVLEAKLSALEVRLALPRDRYSEPHDYDRGWHMFREDSRAYRRAKRELEMKRDAALRQRTFDIQLKDGGKLSAELVEVSTAYDLALLRVSGYRTPFIPSLLEARLRQMQRVYAIGSPLGLQDTVTAGIYAGERDGMLVTDAQIRPGESGGPLVTETGFVIGINSWQATPEPDAKASGFGVSIPIDLAFEEFPDLRAPRTRSPADTTAR